jgi:hypothetical protein
VGWWKQAKRAELPGESLGLTGSFSQHRLDCSGRTTAISGAARVLLRVGKFVPAGGKVRAWRSSKRAAAWLLFLSEGEGGASDSILYFRVDDICAAQAALSSRGIEFTHGASHPHPCRRHRRVDGIFKDNEGRAFALMSQVALQD